MVWYQYNVANLQNSALELVLNYLHFGCRKLQIKAGQTEERKRAVALI